MYALDHAATYDLDRHHVMLCPGHEGQRYRVGSWFPYPIGVCRPDSAVARAVRYRNEGALSTTEGLEALTTGMSRKIWQKIALLPQSPGVDSVAVSAPSL